MKKVSVILSVLAVLSLTVVSVNLLYAQDIQQNVLLVAETLQKKIEKTQGEWYVQDVFSASKNFVVLIADHHHISRVGDEYNNIFDLAVKYIDFIGIEGAIYKSEDLTDVIKNVSVENNLLNRVRKSEKRLVGLEEKNLYISSLCVLKLHKVISLHLDTGKKKKNLPKIEKAIKICYKHISFVGSLPKYNKVVWNDPDKMDVYLDSLMDVMQRYAIDERSKIAIKIVAKECSSSKQNGLVIYGAKHMSGLLDELKQRRISYIALNNHQIDGILRNLEKAREILNRIQ